MAWEMKQNRDPVYGCTYLQFFFFFFKKKKLIMKYSIYAEEEKHHNTAATDCGMFIQFNVKMSRVAPTLRQYLHPCEVGMTNCS